MRGFPIRKALAAKDHEYRQPMGRMKAWFDQARLTSLKNIMQIRIYTKAYCSYCYAAKSLLARRGLAFEEVPLSGDSEMEKEMRNLTGGTTVPQILIDGVPIGGYTDLVDLDMQGKLESSNAASSA